MTVGVLTVELALLEARSLKDKRRVILSVKQRIRNRFNVSVAEVDHLNAVRRCTLGIAIISNGAREAHSQLDRLVELIREARGVTLMDYDRFTV